MAGRKPSIAKEVVNNVFNFEVTNFVRGNKLIEPSDQIWEAIKEKYKWPMSTKAIYERARKWKLQLEQTKQSNVASDGSEQSINISDLPETTISSVETANSENSEKRKVRFKITLW